jgi:hypothetical protein
MLRTMTRSKAFQVQLEPEQHRRLQRLAELRDRSMGSLIRESVAAYLADVPAEEEPLTDLVGMFLDDGPRSHGDVGEEHDAYLADAGAGEADTRRSR